jgi:hypothetical protein
MPSRIVMLIALVLAPACGPRHQPVTVAQLLSRGTATHQDTASEVVVVGRAENVQPFLPAHGSSGITFRLADGTGSIRVVNEGTLDIRDGTLVQVRGVRREAPGEPPTLLASRIWLVGGGAPP